jgi:hypothetical protein
MMKSIVLFLLLAGFPYAFARTDTDVISIASLARVCEQISTPGVQ